MENISGLIKHIGKGYVATDIPYRNPCQRCGKEVDVPAYIPENLRHLTICQDCYDAERRLATEALIKEQKPDPERLIELACIPALLPVPLRPAFARFLEVPESEKAGLYVYGRPGVGKSCQLAEFARQWCRTKFRRALYVNEVDLYQTLKDWSHHKDAYDHLLTVPLLVVDDLGANKATEWSSSMFYAVLDARSANQRKTILASNLSPGELRALPGFDERVMRRIGHLCEAPYQLTPYTEVKP